MSVANDAEKISKLCEKIAGWEQSGYRGVQYVEALVELTKSLEESSTPDHSALVLCAERSLAALTALTALGQISVHYLGIHMESIRGSSLAGLGKTTEAVAALEIALSLAERIEDTSHVFTILVSLSEECRGTGDFEKGLLLLERAESLLTSVDQPADIISLHKTCIFHFRGILLGTMGRYSAALESFSLLFEMQTRILDLRVLRWQKRLPY